MRALLEEVDGQLGDLEAWSPAAINQLESWLRETAQVLDQARCAQDDAGVPNG